MDTQPLIIALGRAVPLGRTVEAASAMHELSVGQLKLRPTMRPRVAWPVKTRRSITLYAPADGEGLWLGGDQHVSPINGFHVPPGMTVTLTGYHGPIWAVAADGIPQVFAVETGCALFSPPSSSSWPVWRRRRTCRCLTSGTRPTTSVRSTIGSSNLSTRP